MLFNRRGACWHSPEDTSSEGCADSVRGFFETSKGAVEPRARGCCAEAVRGWISEKVRFFQLPARSSRGFRGRHHSSCNGTTR